MAIYTEIGLGELAAMQASPVRSRQLVSSSVMVNLPPVAFGCSMEALAARGKDDALKAWAGSRFSPADVVIWTIDDVLVHWPSGIVTVKDRVLRESLLHFPISFPGFARKDREVTLPAPDSLVRYPNAWHGASGAFRNYFHWLFDILPKLLFAPFGEAQFNGKVLMPPAELGFQRASAELVEAAGQSVHHVSEGQVVHVDQLQFVSSLTGDGSAPHPFLITFYDRLAAASCAPDLPPRKLYISRTATQRRRLNNEAEVIALARRRGYEICDTAQMSLLEQIAWFRAATHILAPHGAGLANCVFSRPGAILCELQMDAYMNLAIRKIAALRGLRYGSVVGDAVKVIGTGPARHQMTWSIDVQRVAGALDQAA